MEHNTSINRTIEETKTRLFSSRRIKLIATFQNNDSTSTSDRLRLVFYAPQRSSILPLHPPPSPPPFSYVTFFPSPNVSFARLVPFVNFFFLSGRKFFGKVKDRCFSFRPSNASRRISRRECWNES